MVWRNLIKEGILYGLLFEVKLLGDLGEKIIEIRVVSSEFEDEGLARFEELSLK